LYTRAGRSRLRSLFLAGESCRHRAGGGRHGSDRSFPPGGGGGGGAGRCAASAAGSARPARGHVRARRGGDARLSATDAAYGTEPSHSPRQRTGDAGGGRHECARPHRRVVEFGRRAVGRGGAAPETAGGGGHAGRGGIAVVNTPAAVGGGGNLSPIRGPGAAVAGQSPG